MSAPSIREIARSLGLSHTTVSEALRESPRVNPATRKRVQKAAKAVGYRPNPLAGALMSEMRRARSGTFRGVLAILDHDGPDGRSSNANRYHRELARGASERAAELGFKAETIITGTRGISDARLDTILQTRGIRGLLLLPIGGDADLSGLDWSHFAGVYTDYLIEKPALHAVCPDHYRSMVFAVQKLHGLGYHRLGLVLHGGHDARLLHRWEAAFHTYHEHHSQKEALPPLVLPEIDKKSFIRWFKTKNPDAVLCHRAEVMEWMIECGAKIPETHGFCCLNVATNTVPCAGLDLQPGLLGARGVELLIAALHRNDCGAPEHPSTTTIPAVWVDGPTLKKV
ncbi:LacI family DNA-binding transcriptional regulator [Oleiharenicola lentus]|uniref:LacI family DNA-binding transcriptional regulator n=1 Tax=Oleiharenicola lentus TaxID=2508720 RepID=UPI003F680F7B